MVRGAIVHEDNLINHRLTWLLVVEGFLLGGFAAVQTSVLSNKLSPWAVGGLEFLLIIVFVIALLFCLAIGYAVAMAQEHHERLKKWWMDTYTSEKQEPINIQPEKWWLWKWWREPVFEMVQPPINVRSHP